MSDTSADLREYSVTSLEERLAEELRYPVKRYAGYNRITMCGRRARCFMGEQPKALILSASMINVPMTYFNVAIAPVPLWGPTASPIILALGVFLQLASNSLMIWASVIDPGIVPATLVSQQACSKVDKKYLNIKTKS